MARPWIMQIGIAAGIVGVTAPALLWASSVLWGLWWLNMNIRTVIAIAVLALVPFAAVVAAIWWLWWRLPRHQMEWLTIQIPDPKARADTEDNFRKTIGQVLGGAAVLIGAGAAYLQFTQQQKAAHDLLISNQVSKGFEQLAAKDSLTRRLGGIYALEGVLNTSAQYHQAVLDALCAFVREGTKQKVDDNEPATDIQAALTVIARRSNGSGTVDLTDARIPGANLTNAKLAGARLVSTDLHGADLSDANLVEANLTFTKLNGTFLNGADLRRATIEQRQLDQACGAGVMLSVGLTPPEICSEFRRPGG